MIKKLIENNILSKGIGISHKLIHILFKNKKKYLAHCKSKTEIRGGGKKPWKQKKSGRARSGSRRSSIWVGGIKSFGPRYILKKKNKINKREHRVCILLMLLIKISFWKLINLNKNFFFNIKYYNKFCNIYNKNIINKWYIRIFLSSIIKSIICIHNYNELVNTFFDNNNKINLCSINYIYLSDLLKIHSILIDTNCFKKINEFLLYEKI